jgi:adenylate cyclase
MNGYPAALARCFGVAALTALAICTGSSPAAAQTPGPTRQTIAVLPLDNNSGDTSQDFFAGGMTDEIAVALTGVRGLGVVARSSSFLLAPPSRDTKAIGEKLGAEWLVQGAARIVGDRVRLNLRLVRAGDGAALWSQDYDAERAKIFDIEEDIAEKIAAALQAPAAPGEVLVRSRTGDFDVYLDFLRAKVAARPRGAKQLVDVAAILEQAVMRDPNFAPAAALLAYGYAPDPAVRALAARRRAAGGTQDRRAHDTAQRRLRARP